MKNWKTLYKEQGVLHSEPSQRVILASDYLRKKNVKIILDVGCGTGRHVQYLIKQGFSVYGCDYSQEALTIAKKNIPKGSFIQADMTSLPYQDGFFDAIVCYQVIQHGLISDIKQAISEMHRVLKAMGVLFLVVISTDYQTFNTGEEIEHNTKIHIDALDGDMPHHFFDTGEMFDYFQQFSMLSLEHVTVPSSLYQDRQVKVWELFAQKE